MSNEDFIKKVGKIAREDMLKTGVLASVTIAQAILESGYGTTELAKNARNYFGMKCTLSGNTWRSVWDGKSKYTKRTAEQKKDGTVYYVTADFRKYPDLETSVNDHSLYLLGAKNGSKLRYEGLKGERNYKKAIQIIKDGGYATDVKYVSKVCNIIERYNLTKYDTIEEAVTLHINKNPNFGTHNTSPRSEKIKYIVIHYVGATGDAKANINYYNERSTTGASADFYVGHSGDIWQYNPDPLKRYCWAVGGKKQSNYATLYGIAKNANTVHIEMCVKTRGSKTPNSKDWYFTDATINSTIELTKYLMKLYNIPASRVIRHFDVNGKYCPGVVGWNKASGSESAWNNFKAKLTGKTTVDKVTSKEIYRVRKSWSESKTQIGAYENLENAKKVADENTGYNVYNSNGVFVYGGSGVPFTVRVKISDLNIRKGPGTNYDRVRYIHPGIYTVVEIKAGKGSTIGWGKLKSGLGWISLDYVERV